MYVAYYLHWSLDEIVDLDHRARAEVIDRIGAINDQVSPSP